MFFLGDIAFMLELFGFCLALVLLHQAKKEDGLVRAAGIILLIGSIVLALCTSMGVYKRRAFIEKEYMEHTKQERLEKK
jgi:hypothetical protein